MPYKVKGKCVYKKSGKKVGCTKGPVKKYLAALYANVGESVEKNLQTEMTTSSTGVGGVAADLASNSDTYAPGDTRIANPLFKKIITRRGTIGKLRRFNPFNKKYDKKHVSEQNNNLVDYCKFVITSKNLEQITEDILEHSGLESYYKERLNNGHLVLTFEAQQPSINHIGNKINGLFGDRINKHIFVTFEKANSSQLEKGTEEELEHKNTIKKLKSNGSITLKKGAKMIARDHIKSNPKYYDKLKKAGL